MPDRHHDTPSAPASPIRPAAGEVNVGACTRCGRIRRADHICLTSTSHVRRGSIAPLPPEPLPPTAFLLAALLGAGLAWACVRFLERMEHQG